MRATAGRVVHYVPLTAAPGVGCQPAMVTAEAAGGEVMLTVLTPESIVIGLQVRQDETEKSGGTWHWPEREPE